MQKGTILSVDDDKDLQTVLEHYLENDGYKVVTANTVQTAFQKTASMTFDVILLDLVLPDGEGLSLIPQIRAKTMAPIIVVSGKSDTMEKIVCLEMGADDYLTKPFEMRELSARIKAVLRRSNDNSGARPGAPGAENGAASAGPDKILFNGWRLDRGQYQLFDQKNKSADLTTGEFKLLEALALAPQRTLTREHLFDLTRDQNYESYDRAIDIQIARIRKKLKKDADLIKTVRGVGYMFCGQVEPA